MEIHSVSPRFEFDLPLLIEAPTKVLFRVLDGSLLGSSSHFLRFDLYPLISPSHMRRHYGFWDIPFERIHGPSTEILLDLSDFTLTLPEGGGTYPRAWQGLTQEEGYCHLHVSVWDASQDPPQIVELQSFPLVIATKGKDLPLKQICIPVTDRCNLACTMCARQGTHDIVEMDIPDEALEPLLDAGPHFVSALLQGQGEPLLYPGIIDLIPRIKARMADGGEVGLTTNATLLTPEMARRLLESGIDFLYFSVDAASKEIYESIRVGADFDQVTENIRFCTRLRADLGLAKPRFMLNFVILEENLAEMPAFVSLAASLNVGNVTFSYCTDSATGDLKAFSTDRLRVIFTEVHENGQRHNVNVYTPPLQKSSKEVCFFMERVVALMPGLVFPCHLMAPGYRTSRRNQCFGDVRRTPLLDIWNAPDYRAFRKQVLAGDFPESCHGCGAKAFLVP